MGLSRVLGNVTNLFACDNESAIFAFAQEHRVVRSADKDFAIRQAFHDDLNTWNHISQRRLSDFKDTCGLHELLCSIKQQNKNKNHAKDSGTIQSPDRKHPSIGPVKNRCKDYS